MMLAPEVRTRVFLPDDAVEHDRPLHIVAVNAVSVERWDPKDAVFNHSSSPEVLESDDGIRFEHWWLFDFTPYGSPVYGWLHEDRPLDWFWKIEITLDDRGLISEEAWPEIVSTLEVAGAVPMGVWIGEIFPFD